MQMLWLWKKKDFSDIEHLALVIRGEMVSTFSHPELLKLERCDLIEEVKNFNIHFLGERIIHTKCVL
jgi:hypothetical protein